MSNKQVIAIFIIGVGLLLGAFWAGLYVVKQNTDANANKSPSSAGGAQPAATDKPSNSTEAAAAGADNNSQFVVYIASFGTLEKAKQLEADLLKLNYRSAFVQMPNSQETLYRVNIGPYDRADAEKVVMMLSNERKGLMILPWKPNP